MKRYLFASILLVFFSFIPRAFAAVSFVTESHSAGSASSATTPSITVSGTNPVLVITTIVDSNTANTTSVTFSGGGTASLIKSVRNATHGYADIWCIANPPAGSGTVSAIFSGSQNYELDAILFTGADQSNPCPSGDAVSTSGTAVSSLSLTPTNLQSGDIAVGNSGDYINGDVASPYISPNNIYTDTSHNVDEATGYGTGALVASYTGIPASYQTFVAARIQQPTSNTPILFLLIMALVLLPALLQK